MTTDFTGRAARRGRVAALALSAILAMTVGCTADDGAGRSAAATESAVAAPTPATTVAANSPPVASRLAASLDALRDAYLAPGALAVVTDGGERTGAASGTTAMHGGAPVVDTDRFRIGSITKPIVAAIVLTAVDRGELSLDTVAADVLPGVLRPDPPITVRQLLSHTSGIFDEGNEGDLQADIARLPDASLRAEATTLLARYAAGERVVAPAGLLVALAETHDRYFAPGTGSHYSNIGYQVLGMMLEKVTGQALAELLRTRVVAPLGLHATTLAPADTTSPDLRGYDLSATGEPMDVTDDLATYGNGANGGVVTTADELSAILRAVVTGRLFPMDLVTEMERPVRESYGLGLATFPLACGAFFGHGGSVSGTQSIALVSPDGERAAVVAINLRTASDPGLTGVAERALCGS